MYKLTLLRWGTDMESKSYVSYSSNSEVAEDIFSVTACLDFYYCELKMESAAVTGTVSVKDQRSYIKKLYMQKSDRNTQCFVWSVRWVNTGPQYFFSTGSPFWWKSYKHKRWRKIRTPENIIFLIFAYDQQGVIITDRVTCSQSITGLYYRAFLQKRNRKIHKTQFSCLKLGAHSPWQCSTACCPCRNGTSAPLRLRSIISRTLQSWYESIRL